VGKKNGEFTLDGKPVYVSEKVFAMMRRQGLLRSCVRCGEERSFYFPDTMLCSYCEQQFELDAGLAMSHA
jgi:uncharacterized OB-fold protein